MSTNQTEVQTPVESPEELEDTIGLPFSEPEHHERDDWTLLKFFASYLKPHWKMVAVALAAVPFAMSSTIVIPLLIVEIVDQYIVPADLDGLYLMIGIFAGTVLVGYVSDSTYTFYLQKAGQFAISEMRHDLFRHTLCLPRRYFDRHPIGVNLTRLTSDMEALGESLALGVLTTITDILKTLALFVVLLYLSWQLTMVVLVVIPFMYGIGWLLKERLRLAYNKAREALAESTGFLQECLNGVKTVQLYAAEAKVQERYEQKTRRFLRAQSTSNFFDASLFSVIEGITSITVALMLFYGANQILAGALTIGVVIGFINTLNRIFVPIREFTQQLSTIQRALSALQHIDRLFQEKPEPLPTRQLSDLESQLSEFESLVFKDVYFRYSDQGQYVLKGVSFSLKKGQRLAIVGATGSGKSTILRLLTKAYTHYQGHIYLNGIELADIPRKRLFEMMALMQQDVFLFNQTINFNIGLDRPGLDQQKIQEAARYVYADEFIESLPQKYQHALLENGKNLSAGQAQLISFARAIAGDNELILLDEATSAVDSVTESSIQLAIEKIFQHKTVVAIAHRLSTIRHSDQILVMQMAGLSKKETILS